jgi:branched-chain amino acid transport system ATP-binding protein
MTCLDFPAWLVRFSVLLALQAPASVFDLIVSRARAALHDQVMTMLSRFRLADRMQDAAAVLSHDQRQWLEIVMALAGKRLLLLLDEPTGGMSVEERLISGELCGRSTRTVRLLSSNTISTSSATSATG